MIGIARSVGTASTAGRDAQAVNNILLFFFNDTATTEIYTLSLHDALPIYQPLRVHITISTTECVVRRVLFRSEEHTSELQSPCKLVCRLLLEKNKKTKERRFTGAQADWGVAHQGK